MTLQVDIQLDLNKILIRAEFEFSNNGIYVLFGPSGCGKTTLLRCVAGLEKPQGIIKLDDQYWQNDADNRFISAHERQVGYVFQDTRLFSHLTVNGNLLFAARRSNTDKKVVGDVVAMLGLEDLLNRLTTSLSGGEKQRVAIGRALLSNPKLLLLDEPMSALDFSRKAEILPYIKNINSGLKIPVIYVTHNLDELIELSDNMLLMEKGRVIGNGETTELLSRLDLPIAQRGDASSLLKCEYIRYDETNHLLVLGIGKQQLLVSAAEQLDIGSVRLRVQARDVSLCLSKPESSSILNILQVTIAEIGAVNEFGQQMLKLQLEGKPLLARLTEYSVKKLGFKTGMQVYAQIKSVALITRN